MRVYIEVERLKCTRSGTTAKRIESNVMDLAALIRYISGVRIGIPFFLGLHDMTPPCFIFV